MQAAPGVVSIFPSTLRFLRALALNNNRDWFAANKRDYTRAKENAESLMDDLLRKMSSHDRLENESGKKSIFRIHSDMRFSPDKLPYRAKFSGYLRRVKPELRGGYFITIEPGATNVTCGFIYPNPADLKRIRQDISLNFDVWQKLLNGKGLKSNFGPMHGDRLSTAPRGFSKEDHAVGILRFKQFLFTREFTDREVTARDFSHKVNTTFRAIRPFFNYMTEILTTNVNGEPLV